HEAHHSARSDRAGRRLGEQAGAAGICRRHLRLCLGGDRRVARRTAGDCRRTGGGGDVLFALDDSNETQAVAGANARLAQAEAQLADLKTGKRDEEIAVLAAALSAARATFSSADDNYTRQLVL